MHHCDDTKMTKTLMKNHEVYPIEFAPFPKANVVVILISLKLVQLLHSIIWIDIWISALMDKMTIVYYCSNYNRKNAMGSSDSPWKYEGNFYHHNGMKSH